MGMNVGHGSSSDPDVMVEINTTPLIDVMLVLLIMLIITIPIQLHSVNLNMPVGNPPPPAVKPEVVRIDIDGDGAIRWNGEEIAAGPLLAERLGSVSRVTLPPEIHVRPDKKVDYRVVAGEARCRRLCMFDRQDG